MNRDRKLTVLESLLERVRLRASRHHASSAVVSPAAAAPAPAAAAPTLTLAASSAPSSIDEAPVAGVDDRSDVAATSAVESVPPAREGDGLFDRPISERPLSEPPSDLDEEEGPPSAPRLREGLMMDEDDEEQGADQDFQDDEGPLKTPPPESGRQHVASPVPATESPEDLDVDISITVTETEFTPQPSSPMASESLPSEAARMPESERVPASATQSLDLGGPLPRLAFVSEPEIELHVRPRTPVAAPTGPTHAEPPTQVPSDVPAAAPIPDEPSRVAASSAPADLFSEPRPAEHMVAEAEPAPRTIPSAPPVRLMAHPGVEAGSTPAPPVEVWASTHAPAPLRAQVATFVGQNATFTPKSFGELLDASLRLGES